MEIVKRVAIVSTAASPRCIVCEADFFEFADCVNHYLQQHYWVLLHVGQDDDSYGEPVHFTLAVVGEPLRAGRRAVE